MEVASVRRFANVRSSQGVVVVVLVPVAAYMQNAVTDGECSGAQPFGPGICARSST